MVELAIIADLKTLDAMQGRVYPMRVPQKPVYPNVVVQRIASPRVSSLTGPSGLAHPIIQIDPRGRQYGDAKTLADIIRKRYDGFKGSLGTYKIQGMHLEDEHDREDKPDFGDDVAIYRVCMTFRVWYEEAL